MKKILQLFRSILVFVGWTFVFISISNLAISLTWNFNFLSIKSWKILYTFWNNGGVLKTSSDILLITSLFSLPLWWLIGFYFALKIKYINVLLSPIKLFYKIFDGKLDTEPERIVIKNMKSSQQMIEDIKAEIEALKPEKSKEAGNIRSEITKKISEEIKN